MRTFNTEHMMEFSDEQQYDIFLERVFYRIEEKKDETVSVESFKNMIQKSGFNFAEGEFENLVKWYFRGKETITMEEFKLFATGQCIKMSDPKKK